jgi:hypothetical protein
VPLPDDLAHGLEPSKPRNPIKTLIRNGFRRNKRDTSPRLIVSALKNGYRFLTLLSRAAAGGPGAPEHTSVTSFIRENNARVLAIQEKARAAKAARPSMVPDPTRIPVLVRVSADGESPPRYEPRPGSFPRPLESLPGGVRKPPSLCDATGIPFLRFGKPQPRFLERALRHKTTLRQQRVLDLLEMQHEYMEDAAWEDEWEWLVGGMLQGKPVPVYTPAHERLKKGSGQGKGQGGPKWSWTGDTWGWRNLVVGGKGKVTTHPLMGYLPKGESSYQHTLWDGVMLLFAEINAEREDLIARAHAMWQIVLAEEEQALKEEKERLVREGRGDEEPKLRVWRRHVWQKKRPRPDSTEGGRKDAVSLQ